MFALVLYACAPSTPPARFYSEGVSAESLDAVVVEYWLWDAADQTTTASGDLTVEVRRPGDATVLCTARTAVTSSDDDATYRYRVSAPWDARCPVMAAGEKRVLRLTLTPSSGPPVTASTSSWRGPVFEVLPAPPTPPPPPAPEVVQVGTWNLTVAAYAPVWTATSDDEGTLTSAGCAVTLRRVPSDNVAIMGMTLPRAKADVANWGGVITSEDSSLKTTPAYYISTWKLHYTVAPANKRSIYYGLAEAYEYMCRGTYDTEEAEACGAAICASMSLRSSN